MDSRREFLKKAFLLSGAAGLSGMIPGSIQRALAINPAAGSTFLDAEHIVILMQENRSFDHCFGTLRGVRGFNDPRAIALPDGKPVWLQTNGEGQTYSPFRMDMFGSKATWMGDLPHSRESQVDAYHGGRYDKWLDAKRSHRKEYADMPLTMGFFNRQDLPFYYALADGFTICDQHFCSAMTSTTPNRSFFWTGRITDEVDGLPKAHIRNSDYHIRPLSWQTFPELLEDNGISWRFYQNEISTGGGFQGEERAWLGNFGCNPLESFAAYNVKFAPYYIRNLEAQANALPLEIRKLQDERPSTGQAADKLNADIRKKQEVLASVREELKKWTRERFENLSDREKRLYTNAFTVNSGDPNYRTLATLDYTLDGKPQSVEVPAGDVFHQFRQDVNSGRLPQVSWLAAPARFSDHPSAPMYGAWYVSEVLDILTRNPEVWKKTIFITTYDENDGYFDHVAPYSIPDNNIPGTGKCSAGIDTEIEHIRLENELKQGVPEKQARGGPVGLGFRVPLIIASPWTRGGKVCSEVFDLTSTLQFMESFFSSKLKKEIRIGNISEWRRTICGDLSSAFSPFDEGTPAMSFLARDGFVKDIHSAKFKDIPKGYKQWSGEEIAKASESAGLGLQEEGTRPSCAIPYELYADGGIDAKTGGFAINMKCGNAFFGERSAGSPFTVYAPDDYKNDREERERGRSWSFAVKAGDEVQYQWPLGNFDPQRYHLRLYGPNGFYREWKGEPGNAMPEAHFSYETDPATGRPTGNGLLKLTNSGQRECVVHISDKAYGEKPIRKNLAGSSSVEVVLPLGKSSGWYDVELTLHGAETFQRRFAGRVETGKDSISDPYMGRVIPGPNN